MVSIEKKDIDNLFQNFKEKNNINDLIENKNKNKNKILEINLEKDELEKLLYENEKMLENDTKNKINNENIENKINDLENEIKIKNLEKIKENKEINEIKEKA